MDSLCLSMRVQAESIDPWAGKGKFQEVPKAGQSMEIDWL